MKYKIVLHQSEEGYSVRCPDAGLRVIQKPRLSKIKKMPFRSTSPLCMIPLRIRTCAKSKWPFEMPKLAGIQHLHAIRALEKAGFKVVRQGNNML